VQIVSNRFVEGLFLFRVPPFVPRDLDNHEVVCAMDTDIIGIKKKAVGIVLTNDLGQAYRNLSVRLAVNGNLPFFNLAADVQLLSVECEGPSLCRFPLSEDEPINNKRMVVLPSPLDRVDPR